MLADDGSGNPSDKTLNSFDVSDVITIIYNDRNPLQNHLPAHARAHDVEGLDTTTALSKQGLSTTSGQGEKLDKGTTCHTHSLPPWHFPRKELFVGDRDTARADAGD